MTDEIPYVPKLTAWRGACDDSQVHELVSGTVSDGGQASERIEADAKGE